MLGKTMPPARPRTKARPASGQQDWEMLIFESLSAGGIAVLIALAAVLVLAGIYALTVWPLTHWDLARVEGGSWWKYALGLIFAAGATAGFWCFSGAAFREKAGQRRSSAASRSNRNAP